MAIVKTAVYSLPTFTGVRQARAAKYFVMFGLLIFMGLVLATSTYITRALNAQPVDVLSALLTQVLPQLIWCALTPSVVWLDERIRARNWRWPRILAVHLLASLLLSAVQIALFALLYWPLHPFSLIGYLSLPVMLQTIFPTRMVMSILCYKLIVTTKYALDYYAQYRAEQRHSAVLEAQLAQAQLQALKMQLQPHFLFNALNSISSLTLEDPRAAVHMIARLGDFLRLTIETNGTQEVSLARELEFLRCYLEIEQIRFRDRLRVKIEAEPESLDARVPNLILQPIIENAIKHGISARASSGKIEIAARRHNGHLQIEVRDDGPGLPPPGMGLRGLFPGVGLANTRERLRQLYKDDFDLAVQDAPAGGAVVRLEIPFTLSTPA